MKKLTTPCEDAFREVVPVLRIAIAKRLIERGIPVVKASKEVGISATTYEKQIKNKKEEVKKVISDEEINDMIESLVGRILSGQTVESTSFCILCSKSRRLFNLPPCPNL
ncbi:transcriptional regulator [Stygiolobus caldivivus]|uniref:Transcriptional regulator n=1 Tax=Stygiolobus caldivivus TaxID=2824673 RepID=A0A8D5ZJS7_9CREN|nr:transcriptional regulator [Stygiolobus caldivivus]BCU70951.1 transcriptional regulator [Stygiolobus caldivivus]